MTSTGEIKNETFPFSTLKIDWKTENAQFLPARHYFCLQDIKISFDQADLYTKISLILHPSERNSITQLILLGMYVSTADRHILV